MGGIGPGGGGPRMGPYGPIGPPGPIGPGPRGGVILGPMLGGPGGLLGSMPEESIGCPGCCNVQMYFILIYSNLSWPSNPFHNDYPISLT